MRSQLFRWLLTASLLGGPLIIVDDASAQPTVRDHRKGPKRLPHQDAAGPVAPVNAGPPREAPPAPRQEKIGFRKKHVWVAGHWESPPGEGYVWVPDPPNPHVGASVGGQWRLKVEIDVGVRP